MIDWVAKGGSLDGQQGIGLEGSLVGWRIGPDRLDGEHRDDLVGRHKDGVEDQLRGRVDGKHREGCLVG